MQHDPHPDSHELDDWAIYGPERPADFHTRCASGSASSHACHGYRSIDRCRATEQGLAREETKHAADGGIGVSVMNSAANA